MSDLVLPRVIGHRGAAASAPENTLAGFRHAAGLGVGWVELDVQLSADGIPVVFHDDGLERTTNGQGRLVETSLVALRRLDAGAWFAPAFVGEQIPTLAEVVALAVSLDLCLNIEIKATEARAGETARTALAVALSAWPAEKPAPLVSSFARSALIAAAEVVPAWPRGMLVEKPPADWLVQARRLGCGTLHADHRQLERVVVDEALAAGVPVLAYTVNDHEIAKRLWDWGVRSVYTDHPERLAEPS